MDEPFNFRQHEIPIKHQIAFALLKKSNPADKQKFPIINLNTSLVIKIRVSLNMKTKKILIGCQNYNLD